MRRTTRTLVPWLIALAAGFALYGCGGDSDDQAGEQKGTTMSKAIPEGKNRLALEKSPYLLQHQDNPVDWYPWGDEAFAKAKAEGKPIFLSIGYSTCHWCHVMEHESFEDPEVAALMNDAFVNIKVDREERPDVDNVYMTVCQMATGSGGWPLTIIMTPDKKPFFAATYLPKTGRYGRPGMMELIPQIKQAWTQDRAEIENHSERITAQLSKIEEGRAGTEDLGAEVLKLAHSQISGRFDDVHGGFGNAPKFPTPHNMMFLLRHWKRTGEARALEMVEKTLQEMSRGGIYDHVGFGFARYSTDARWFAPHFEKMLYDQALLVMTFAEVYQATGKPEYRRIADEVITYVLRDMTHGDGGFFSAEDADSEGIEGKFYLWAEAELKDLLAQDDAELFIDLYGVDTAGNFHEEVEGGNILFLRRPMAVVAEERGLTEEALRERVEKMRVVLFEAREKRIHPGKDDKILTDWNGLMIAALAKAARAFDDKKYTAAAEKAMRFVIDTMLQDDGRLLHRYRDGAVGLQASVDDYAFVVWALIELYELTFDVGYLDRAIALNETLVERFWDDEGGGLYFSPDDGEELIVRMKEVYDGAVPSGNSVAMLNLIRLGRLTAEPKYEELANSVGRAFGQDVNRSPGAFTLLLTALDFGVGPSHEIVIVGKRGARDTRAMQRAIDNVYMPNKVVLLKPSNEPSPRISELARYTESQQAIEGKATAYVCINYACELPTTDVEQMLSLITHAPE
jgi:uncharacterized protein YyaL (SSP411 family)